LKKPKKPSPTQKEQENSLFLPLFAAQERKGLAIPDQFTSLGWEEPQKPRKSLLKPEKDDD
jgi:hypothetical protein